MLNLEVKRVRNSENVFKVVLIVIITSMIFWLAQSVHIPTIYYISPSGSDNNIGLSDLQPWATFSHAWTILQPGDTLLLMDGRYYQSIQPTINGKPGNLITVKAEHDGQVIIDGQHRLIPVWLGNEWNSGDPNELPNPVGNYFAIEGLIAKDSSASVYQIRSRNIILRRDSGYNADTTKNTAVFWVWSKGTPTFPANILIEDCVAAGSGRKMFVAVDTYVNVVFRRDFAAWQSWEGGDPSYYPSYWPWGDGIEIYPIAYGAQPDVPNNSIVENSIVFGKLPNYGFSLSPNPAVTRGNKFLGLMALNVGMDWTGNSMIWPCPHPISSSYPCTKFSDWQSERAGFVFGTYQNPTFINNTFQDLFAWGNAGTGIAIGEPPLSAGWTSTSAGNLLNHITLVNNGLGVPPPSEGKGINMAQYSLDMIKRAGTAQNLYIEKNPTYSDITVGARLRYRYVNGVLMDGSNGQPAQELWPWPMENRIRSEFKEIFGVDFSVNNTIYPILVQYGAISSDTLAPSWHIASHL